MFTVLILLGVAVVATGLIALELRKAPEGYEDATGFHAVRKVPPASSRKSAKATVPKGKLVDEAEEQTAPYGLHSPISG
jgi:hypothetical protein